MGMAVSSILRFSSEILTTPDDVLIDHDKELEKLEALWEAQEDEAITKLLLHSFKPGNIVMFYSFGSQDDHENEMVSLLCGTVVMTNSPATIRAVDILDLQLLLQFSTFAGFELDDADSIDDDIVL